MTEQRRTSSDAESTADSPADSAPDSGPDSAPESRAESRAASGSASRSDARSARARAREAAKAARKADSKRVPRVRMSGNERREQLLDIGRGLFAERGFEATSIEEVAARAGVSKPVVYEHFGGKEGLYAVVVDREMRTLLEMVTGALTGAHPRILLEEAALALLDYIETQSDGFRILVRDSPVTSTTGTFSSLIGDIATQVEYILAAEFKRMSYDAKLASLYSQALVGMVALTGQWWLDARKPKKDEVAAHLVNLAWNGLSHLEKRPRVSKARKNRRPAND